MKGWGELLSLKYVKHKQFNIDTKNGHMGVSLNGGTQQPWVFLLKMIILGCFGGTTI